MAPWEKRSEEASKRESIYRRKNFSKSNKSDKFTTTALWK